MSSNYSKSDANILYSSSCCLLLLKIIEHKKKMFANLGLVDLAALFCRLKELGYTLLSLSVESPELNTDIRIKTVGLQSFPRDSHDFMWFTPIFVSTTAQVLLTQKHLT